jgi:adenosine deaminase
MNILVATLGGSWQVIPEIYGFTNHEALPLYSCSDEIERIRQEYLIKPVDEIWLVTTAGREDQWDRLKEWQELLGGKPLLRRWYLKGINDLTHTEDIHFMADLIYRVVLSAREKTRKEDGKLYLCLAGGRKTMSTDLKQAGHVFGCDAELHVVERFPSDELRREFNNQMPQVFTKPLNAKYADTILPVVISGPNRGSEAIRTQNEISSKCFPLPQEEAVPPEEKLYLIVHDSLERADALLANYRLRLVGGSSLSKSNFRALYTMSTDIIEKLQKEHIGKDPSQQEEELLWLRSLPKAELHCHLGGILSVQEMIRVAASVEDKVYCWAKSYPEFDKWLHRLKEAIKNGATKDIKELLPGKDKIEFKKLRHIYSIPEPFVVCAFLLSFQEHHNLLEQLLFGALKEPQNYVGIGFTDYEALGDLQGSGLLQCEETIRASLEILRDQCRQENIRYLELRCSPEKYTQGNLSSEQVIEILLDEISSFGDCEIRLIFIASRHKGEEVAKREIANKHVNMALKLLKTNERFQYHFAGFDMAGAEDICTPNEMRDLFRPVQEHIIKITIHAGEGQKPQNIWEAVYELSADRIGHGLTLREEPKLIDRFRDRRIAIEMCPSSNYQIIGFKDYLIEQKQDQNYEEYPLKKYLDTGLQVTVNTDNPGISLTTLSQEYLKAAAMTKGGLTRWEVLQLIRNGFRAAFCDYSTRQHLLREAEHIIITNLSPF